MIAKRLSGRWLLVVRTCWMCERQRTYSSRWNKHLCRTYSIMVQKPSPKAQYPASSMVDDSPPNATAVPTATQGHHSDGTIHHGVLLSGSKKLPNNGAESPPL